MIRRVERTKGKGWVDFITNMMGEVDGVGNQNTGDVIRQKPGENLWDAGRQGRGDGGTELAN